LVFLARAEAVRGGGPGREEEATGGGAGSGSRRARRARPGVVDASAVEEAVRVTGGGGGGGGGALWLEEEDPFDFVGEEGISERGEETDCTGAAGGGGGAVEDCSMDEARISLTGEGSFSNDGSDEGTLFPSRREAGALEIEA